MEPKLTVIIPCYNMGHYVGDALDSVLKYPNQEEIEIIIINDGSDDNGFTEGVLESLHYGNLKVIHQENRGLGHARNIGFKQARAPYILPLDADNILHAAYIDNGISIMDAHPELGVVYGDFKQFGLLDSIVDVGDFDISRLIKSNYIDACVVMRKTAWESVKGYDELMPIMGFEDWDIHMRLFFKGWQFKYVNSILYEYRVRDNSMLATAHQHWDKLIDYMFSKPELRQAQLLREKIMSYYRCDQQLKKIQKKKIVKLALKMEAPIQKMFFFLREK